MIVKLLYGAGAVALIAATAVMAQPTGPEAKAKSDRQICRTNDDTGSHLARHRECHTLAEWAALQRESSQDVDRMRSSQQQNGR